METYSKKLTSPRWQKKRLEIMSRDHFKCQKCGDEESELHVHHKEYSPGKEPWDYPDANLITLCGDCHKFIEGQKKVDQSLPFSEIKIFKKIEISNGGKIMFSSARGDGVINIYVNDRNVAGFNFDKAEMVKILKLL